MAKKRDKRKNRDVQQLRKMAQRSDTTLLSYTVILFQFTALLLLSLKTQPLDLQALSMAIGLPLATLIVVVIVPRIWPVDRVVLVLMLFLCSIGLVTLQDIAKSPITPRNQGVFMLAGLMAMLMAVVFIRRIRAWEKWVPYLMGLSLLALASPLVIGQWQYGAKNWIKLGPISVQPSEFVKLSLMVVLAASFSGRRDRKSLLITLGFAACCCGLLLVARDLGAVLLYFGVTVMLYYIATSNLLVTGAGLAAGVLGAVASYHLFPHVKKRVEVFLNPWADPLDKGYQIVQALIAIGSGGMLGMGLGLGLPRNIPLYHSDFVFAAISEEFGCLFALCMLAVYVLIIMRGVSIAMSARTGFHSLLAFGVVAMMGLQAFTIVGGVIKLIPLTGVTLPFVSAGGSSLVSSMAGMGLLLGISSINAEEDAGDLARLSWKEEMDA